MITAKLSPANYSEVWRHLAKARVPYTTQIIYAHGFCQGFVISFLTEQEKPIQ